MTRTAWFGGLAVLGALGLGAEWAMPHGPLIGLPAPAPLSLPVPSTPRAATLDEAALVAATDGLSQRPLFRPDRRPPRPPVAATSDAPAPDTPLPRLTGVVVGSAGGRAIFAGPDGKSAVATEGGSLGRFTIKAITPGRVLLAGPEGDIDLRPTLLKTAP